MEPGVLAAYRCQGPVFIADNKEEITQMFKIHLKVGLLTMMYFTTLNFQIISLELLKK